jgi:signal transduction histidine kinase
VSHSDLTNNSPYFLGFLFFLFSLYVTFSHPHGDDSQIVQELGTALLATVVGLPFRQLLFAYSPGQDDEDSFFRSLEDELRRSAAQFRKAQSDLVELIQEFVATRDKLFETEENAARGYIASLERATTIFDDAYQQYPKAIASVLGDCTRSLARVKARLEQLAESADNVPADSFALIGSQMQSLADSANQTTTQLNCLGNGVKDLLASSKSLPSAVEETLTTTAATLSTHINSFRESMDVIRKDIQGLDGVLSEFVELQEKRILATQ